MIPSTARAAMVGSVLRTEYRRHGLADGAEWKPRLNRRGVGSARALRRTEVASTSGPAGRRRVEFERQSGLRRRKRRRIDESSSADGNGRGLSCILPCEGRCWHRPSVGATLIPECGSSCQWKSSVPEKNEPVICFFRFGFARLFAVAGALCAAGSGVPPRPGSGHSFRSRDPVGRAPQRVPRSRRSGASARPDSCASQREKRGSTSDRRPRRPGSRPSPARRVGTPSH